MGLKKWLTAIEAPIKEFSSRDTFAKTFGRKVFLSWSVRRKLRAICNTRLAWSLLPVWMLFSWGVPFGDAATTRNWNVTTYKDWLTQEKASLGVIIDWSVLLVSSNALVKCLVFHPFKTVPCFRVFMLGWHQFFFTFLPSTSLIFFALFSIEQMKQENNLVVVPIWRAYKFQAFSLQLLNCCSFRQTSGNR